MPPNSCQGPPLLKGSACAELLSRSTYFANKGLEEITQDKESITHSRSCHKPGCPLLLLPPVFEGAGGEGKSSEAMAAGRGRGERSPAGTAGLTHSVGLNTINAALSFLERNKIARPKCLGVLK